MRLLRILIMNSVFLIMNFLCAKAQTTGIAYYDLDHLYDTIPALFHNDEDYTPKGRLRWTTERYARKIQNVAAVIDSMRLPIIALNSIENQTVVSDIVAASQGDYTYLHRTLNSLDGMDFALLYYGDLFFPDYDQVGRGYLYVEGELMLPPMRRTFPSARPPKPRRERIGLLLIRDTKFTSLITRDLREERPGVKLVLLGRTANVDCQALGFVDATARAAEAGRGNVRSRSGWYMRDRILVDTALNVSGTDVFARRYLVDPKSGYPIQTYEKRAYKGGISYALPIFCYIH